MQHHRKALAIGVENFLAGKVLKVTGRRIGHWDSFGVQLCSGNGPTLFDTNAATMFSHLMCVDKSVRQENAVEWK